jgi:hypothetical protein
MSPVAENICHLPDVLEMTDIPTAAIITQSGLLDHPEDLSAQSVLDVLESEPELADQWLHHSNDQAAFGGWTIDEEADGFLIKNVTSGSVMFVQNKLEACAEFIVRYVALLLSLVAKSDLAYAI